MAAAEAAAAAAAEAEVVVVVAPASIGWFEARLRVLPFKTPFLSVRCARCPSTKVGEVAASCKIKIKILLL